MAFYPLNRTQKITTTLEKLRDFISSPIKLKEIFHFRIIALKRIRKTQFNSNNYIYSQSFFRGFRLLGLNPLKIFFTFLLIFSIPLFSESKVEIKTGISLSDYQPEFKKRYFSDDLIAGGSNSIGFGALNRSYSQKYYPSVFNPLDFRFIHSVNGYVLLAGIESLGIKGADLTGLRTSFNYPAVGFFAGEGNIQSKFNNTNVRLSASKKFDTFELGAVILGRKFQSEFKKDVTLYAPGFLGLIQAESNYQTSNLFAGFSFVKYFEKGKLSAEISYRPKSLGFISSSGKVEQTGAIRFPIDILNRNFSSDLLVGNYLYGEKKPTIHGMRILTDYQYPIYSNLSISIGLDYDRLIISYKNYSPPAFFRFANNSGISETQIALAEMLSSYFLYRDPIINEIKSLRLSVVMNF